MWSFAISAVFNSAVWQCSEPSTFAGQTHGRRLLVAFTTFASPRVV